jgi:Icc-related predicted phosphoesterase
LPGPGNVDGTVASVAGIRIAGIGGSGPAHFGFPYEWDDDEIRGRVVPPHDVLLSHTPPRDTELDLTRWGGRHAGSAAVSERARVHDGVLVCGHIHEAAGAIQIGRCLCLNAGSLGEPFGQPQVAFVIHDPTTPGQWAVRHEDLVSGEVRRWERRC